MLACGVLTVSSLIQNLVPAWHAGLIAGIMLFIVIDRLYTYSNLKSLVPLSPEWVIALGVQWLVIGLLIRFLLSYASGLDVLGQDLARLARGDMENVITPEFLITFLFALLVWAFTAQFLALLDEIGLDLKWALSDETMIVQSDIVPPHQRLVNLIFGLGIGLVVLTALTRVNLQATFASSQGLPSIEWNRFSGAEAGALLYFVFGLALLSLSRLMSLQTHWNRLRIPVSSANLTRQWGLYSLVFLLALMVVVGLLPAGDSLGFFSLLGAAFEFLIRVLFFILQLLIAIVLLVFSLPFLLFGKAPSFRPGLPTPPPMPPLPDQAAPLNPSALLAVLRSILLWGSLAALLLFLFIHFVRQHEGLLTMLRRSRITNWLILAWQWLYRQVDQTRDTVSRALAEGWQSLVARLDGRRLLAGGGGISLRSLDPRRRIYFFYLAMVRRGGEQGLARQPSQTPAEYARTLDKALPSVEEDIDSLTEAFIEARYSRRDIDAQQAQVVQALWARIRGALQRSRNRNES